MKSLKRKLINFQWLFIIVFLSGCATIQPKDFVANDNKVSKPLPSLEPLIDINSCQNAYQLKQTCSPNILCFPQQNFYDYYTNDASRVFFNDVKKNVVIDTTFINGTIVYKVKTFNAKQGRGFWGWLGMFTGGVPIFLGAPTGYYKSNIEIEINILNGKHEVVSTCDGRGKYKCWHGLYYGYNITSEGRRRCNIEAIKQAMNEVKQKVSIKSDTITLLLNSCMYALNKERDSSIIESNLEQTDFSNGNKNYNEKKYNEAINFYNSVLNIYPYHKYALFNRGNALINIGKYTLAIQDFTRLIELDPQYTEAYYYRGIAKEKLSEFLGAISDFNKSIALNPSMPQAYLAKGFAEDNLSTIYSDMPYTYYLANNSTESEEGIQAAYLFIFSILTFDKEAANDYQHALKLDPDLVLAKERLNIVQNRIEQKGVLQKQQAQEALTNSIADLNSSLNALSNNINTQSSSNKTPNISNPTDCKSWVNAYEEQRQLAEKEINRINKRRIPEKYGNKKSNVALNSADYKLFRSFQSTMRNIRENAAKKGCAIQKAREEDYSNIE